MQRTSHPTLDALAPRAPPAPCAPIFLSGIGYAMVHGWGEHEHHLCVNERVNGWPRVRSGGIWPKLFY